MAAAVVVGVAACGADPESPSTAPPVTEAQDSPDGTTDGSTTTSAAPAAARPDLPAIDVVELASGDTVDLTALATAGRPSLLWFWAPHCTVCRREAPDLLAFAEAHGDEIQILGLGAQDSLEEAYGFLDDTGTHDLRMVWDATGQSWIHHGVTSQPTIIVLGADGQVAGEWYRDFDADGILAAAGLA